MITPNRNASGWESGCGPADPTLSTIGLSTSYAGAGYGTVGQGTINVGNPIVIARTPAPLPQPRGALTTYEGNDGGIYAINPSSGIAFQLKAGTGTPMVAQEQSASVPEPMPPAKGSHWNQISPGGEWRWEGTGQPTDHWVRV
jgi:hypothetical protein